jgi:hypothetical protein
MAKEETFHLQHFKKRWAVKGDRNTDLFHLAIIKRNRKNKISHLVNLDGTQSTSPGQLESLQENH